MSATAILHNLKAALAAIRRPPYPNPTGTYANGLNFPATPGASFVTFRATAPEADGRWKIRVDQTTVPNAAWTVGDGYFDPATNAIEMDTVGVPDGVYDPDDGSIDFGGTAWTGQAADAAYLFAAVGIYDDAESFMDKAGSLNQPVAGVIAGEVLRERGMANDQAYSERMGVEIAFAFPVKRVAGEDEAAAVGWLQLYAGIIRTAVLADRSRGGNAGLVMVDGRPVNGTDVDGEARIIDRRPDQGIYFALLSVTVGWWA